MVLSVKSIAQVLAQNLAKIRKAKGFTQEALADGSGVSLRTIQHIEQADRWPGIETISEIAKILGITESVLFSVSEPEIVKIEPSFDESISYLADQMSFLHNCVHDFENRLQTLEKDHHSHTEDLYNPPK